MINHIHLEAPKDKAIGFWMHRAALAFKQQVEIRTIRHGLPAAQAFVMTTIAHAGPCNIAELVQRIGHSHTAILRQVDALESAGYIERTSHPNDRRVKVLELTPKGLETVDILVQIFLEVRDIALAGFSKSEIQALFSLLSRIVENLGGTGCSSPWASDHHEEDEG